MKQYWLLAIFLVLICSLAAERFVARIEQPTQSDLIRFSNAGYDICAYHPFLYLDLLLDSTSFVKLKDEYPSLHTTQTEADLKRNLVSESKDIPGYRNYAEMLTELIQLQAQYPNLVQLVSLGTTWASTYNAEGYPAYQNYDHQIWAVKLSDNVLVNEDEPYFYFVGEHHAREPISLEMVMSIMNHLLDGYGADPEITNIIDNSQIWFVPLLNPDGHKIVIDQTDVWWRKNLIDNNHNHSIDLGNSGSGPDGTDLNRNYGYEWGYINASGNPSSITYHGSVPFSEMETRAFKELIESVNFVAGISYHTYGQYVLYPFGYMYDIISPDAVEQQALANHMASTIPGVSGGFYTPMPSYSLYPVSGSSDDWIYGTTGAFAYTIEMAEEFIPPAAQVPQIVQNGLTAAKILLNRINTKTLKGHVTDAYTGAPLVAQVHIEGIDDNRLRTVPYKTNELYGSFFRFLPAGTHNVRFICPGYQTEAMNITITDTGATVLDIAMLPAEPVDLNIMITNLFGSPLPGAEFRFVDADSTTYISDANGQIAVPGFLPGTYRITINSSGFEQLTRTLNILGPSITFSLSAVTAISEDFELDLSAWQTTGNWGRSSTHFFSGGFSLADSPSGNYTSNVSSTCRLVQPINLEGVLNANLQFYAKHNIMLDGDYCSLMYSTNGTQWRYLDHFVGVSDWQLHSYNLNEFIGGNLYLRFKMSTTTSSNADGIYIDDIKMFVSSNPSDLDENLLSIPAINLTRYPNPFIDQLSFNLEAQSKSAQPVRLAIYNLKGQLVKELYNGVPENGLTKIYWDGRDNHNNSCASGVYFARLTSNNHKLQTLKTILMK